MLYATATRYLCCGSGDNVNAYVQRDSGRALLCPSPLPFGSVVLFGALVTDTAEERLLRSHASRSPSPPSRVGRLPPRQCCCTLLKSDASAKVRDGSVKGRSGRPGPAFTVAWCCHNPCRLRLAIPTVDGGRCACPSVLRLLSARGGACMNRERHRPDGRVIAPTAGWLANPAHIRRWPHVRRGTDVTVIARGHVLPDDLVTAAAVRSQRYRGGGPRCGAWHCSGRHVRSTSALTFQHRSISRGFVAPPSFYSMVRCQGITSVTADPVRGRFVSRTGRHRALRAKLSAEKPLQRPRPYGLVIAAMCARSRCLVPAVCFAPRPRHSHSSSRSSSCNCGNGWSQALEQSPPQPAWRNSFTCRPSAQVASMLSLPMHAARQVPARQRC